MRDKKEDGRTKYVIHEMNEISRDRGGIRYERNENNIDDEREGYIQ